MDSLAMTQLLTLKDEFWKSTSLDAIWRMAGIILATRDDSGVIVSVNDMATRMFGYDGVLNSMIGMKVDDLVAPELRSGHSAMRAGFNQQPEKRMMGERSGLLGVKRNGATFTVHIGLYPIDVSITPDKKEPLVLLMIV